MTQISETLKPKEEPEQDSTTLEDQENKKHVIAEDIDSLVDTNPVHFGNEPEDEDMIDNEKKQPLLERLFSFVRSKEKPLNPVLSGYFAKLVTLLINRK